MCRGDGACHMFCTMTCADSNEYTVVPTKVALEKKVPGCKIVEATCTRKKPTSACIASTGWESSASSLSAASPCRRASWGTRWTGSSELSSCTQSNGAVSAVHRQEQHVDLVCACYWNRRTMAHSRRPLPGSEYGREPRAGFSGRIC